MRTAQALRDLQYDGRITMLSDEQIPPYDRPPLSKAYLLGKAQAEQVRLLPGERLAELDIDLHLSSRVEGLDRQLHEVRLADGTALEYGYLVVATGARPIRLAQFNHFSNVHVLRSKDDSDRLREVLRPGRRLGVIGGGFIGLEIASAALEMDCSVTVVEMARTPLASILGAELGRCIQRWHERKGVVFHCDACSVSAKGTQHIEALELASGETLPVDDVVVGVGQIPNVEWLAESDLEIRRGLVCDPHGRTVDPRVYGVGDATCTVAEGRYRPTRQWTAVTEQAQRVAGAIMGQPDPGPIVEDFYFWSDQHGLRLQFAGAVPERPQLKWIKGTAEEERYVVLCCNSSQVCAVFSVGCPKDFLLHSMPMRRGESVPVPVA